MTGTEVERLVVSLVGDGSSYRSMMQQAASYSQKTATQIERHASTIQSLTSKVKGYAASAASALSGLVNKAGAVTAMGLGSVGAGAAAGLMGVGGIAGGIAGGGYAMKLAAEAEQSAISFEVMLGSASAAKKMLAELNDFAAKTPFEMPGLRSAAQMMLNFGVAQNKIMPTLKALGDVAAGDQNKLNGLAYAYSQTQAAGRLMGQDLLQMINWGFNPLQEMARTSGKSLAQLKTEMEAGRISAQMVEQAFISASGPGGKFFNMMEKQSNTVFGLWSTLADTIKLEVTKMGAVLIEKLDIRSTLKSVIKTVEVWGPVISNAFGNVIRWIVPKVMWGLNMISDLFQTYISPLLSGIYSVASSTIGAVTPILQDAFSTIRREVGSVIPYLTSFWNTIVSVGASIAEWVVDNADFLVLWAGIAAAVKLAVIGFTSASAVIAGLIPILAAVFSPLGLIIAGITAAAYGLNKFTNIGAWAANQLQSAFKFIGDQFLLVVDLIKNGEFELAWKVITTSVSYLWTSMLVDIESGWIKTKSFIASVWIGLQSALGETFDKMVVNIIESMNWLIESFNAVMPDKWKMPTIDATAANKTLEETRKYYRDLQAENEVMREEALKKASAPGEAARKAWEDAQKAAKNAVDNRKVGGTGIFGFAQMGTDIWDEYVAPIISPATFDRATETGMKMGEAFTSGVKGAVGAIDAVAAGTTKAYDVIAAYRDKMTIQTPKNPNANSADNKPLFETMVENLTELVAQGREKGKGFFDMIGISNIGGA
jgi:tape measure domain-containing protein